ncbi:MAG: hypothetical protein ABNH53_02080 [Henriciella sp.]|jgi:hypothetical protein
MKTIFASIGALAMLQTAAATEVSVTYSEEFTEELADNYGEREGGVLTEEIIEDLDRAFAKAGISPARVDVTINDAKPNRPTLEQQRDKPGLDAFRSISIGGMDLTGTAYDADGNVIGELSYDWYETDIRFAAPAGTWSDARRASDRFSRKLAKQLQGS